MRGARRSGPPHRNRAERARGFRSNSPLEGVNGRELRKSETWRVQFYRLLRQMPRLPRVPCRFATAKNLLTIRSSSEWKVTTTRRPPGFRMRSAAMSAARQFAQLVVDVDAQRLERARRRMLAVDLARPWNARSTDIGQFERAREGLSPRAGARWRARSPATCAPRRGDR